MCLPSGNKFACVVLFSPSLLTIANKIFSLQIKRIATSTTTKFCFQVGDNQITILHVFFLFPQRIKKIYKNIESFLR